MGTTHKAIRGIQEITITEEAVMEINLIAEDGLGHLKDRIEAGEIIEVQVTVGLGQVLEQVRIETEFDASSVESMIILHENVQSGKLGRLVGKQNKYSKCSIWMKTKC